MRRLSFIQATRVAALSAILAAAAAAQAQQITTADQFFQQVSERYAQITDYECRLQIATGKSTMVGNVIYRAPSLLRIDFSQPAGQVIAFDGETLTVYVPEYRAVLSQSVGASPGGGAGLATRDGLKMMKRSYSIAYESNPEPVPLEGSGEMVVRLVLTRKTVAEGFKSIVVSIVPDTKLIRRLEGTTLANERFTFDFTGLKLNQNIPESRFLYDSPASANMYNNFLFNNSDN